VLDELGVSPDAVVLLSLGSLSWEKDPLVLVDVASRILRDVPDAVLLIAGDGPLRDDVESLAARSDVRTRVRLLGSRADVGDLLGASDLMLFTSRDDGMEGMPASLIEAGLAGLPVVAYDVAGVREVVEDGVGGRVVQHGEKAALESAVRELVGDPSLRRQLGSSARERCRTRFEIRTVADRYAEIYRAVVDAA
jgi:glycosyltransferase involved in cell wall biosynthesis